MSAQKAKEFQAIQWVSLAILILVILLLLSICFIRIGFETSIDYNEGWNVYHTVRAISGQLLYDARNQWTPLNYPPLSFYIVGSIGRLIKNPNSAGRWLSFVSLLLLSLGVGYVVIKLGGRLYDAVFAGVFCLGFFLIHGTVYVGLNDPQLLGQLFMMGGLLIYLQYLQSAKSYQLFLAALFMAIALFIKHSLLPLPIAVTIDLFLKSRPIFFKWITYLIIFLGSFSVITLIVEGTDFINELTISRAYSLKRIKDVVGYLGVKATIPLIITLPWFFYAFRTRFRVIPITLVCALGFGLFTVGGYGTWVNMFFDAFISISIAVGMTLSEIRSNYKKQFKYAALILTSVIIVLSLSIVAVAPKVFAREGGINFSWEWKLKQEAFVEDAAFLATQPEPAICENILLCYAGQKKFTYDPFLVSQMMVTGRINERDILTKLASGYFSVIQLDEEQLAKQYQNNLPYTSVPTLSTNERFTINFLQALNKHYKLARKTKSGAFYVPKSDVSAAIPGI